MNCLELQGGQKEIPAGGWSFPPLLCPELCMARPQLVLGGTPGTDSAQPGPHRAQQPQLSPANALWTRRCWGDRVHIAQPPKHFPLFCSNSR